MIRRVLWFDGEWQAWWTQEDGKDLYALVRSLKPDIIINNRVGSGREGMKGLSKAGEDSGDFGTPEQQIPPNGLPGVDWESCMTFNDLGLQALRRLLEIDRDDHSQPDRHRVEGATIC